MPHVNSDMRPYNGLEMGWGFDPNEGTPRDKWDVTDNLTPSVKDAHFPNERGVQDANARTKKDLQKPLLIKLETQEKAAAYTNEIGRITLSQVALREHIEERIAAFLLQIIDCYDTDKYFTIGHTQDQTQSTSTVKFKVNAGIPLPPNPELNMGLASAHHGTLPCIYAYPRAEWEVWKANNNSDAPGKPKPTVYLKYSDTYYLNNACTGLLAEINSAENTDLDGNSTEKRVEFGKKKSDEEKKLREYSIELLNKAATKQIDPIQGFAMFMAKLQSQISQLATTLPDGEKKVIFQAWKRDLDEINQGYQNNYKLFIAKLLGIKMPRGDRETINLQEMIFPRHFKIIQRKDLYQTQLAAKVDVLKKEISSLSITKRKNFDSAFKLALMKEAGNQSSVVKTIFQRYYNCSGESAEALENTLTQTSKPALQLVKSKPAQEKIQGFFQEFSKYIHNFSIDESNFSSELLKQVRAIRGLSLRSFSKKFNEKFPAERRLNHEQLRRIELGCVKVSSKMVKHFAEVLNIHPSALHSGFINE